MAKPNYQYDKRQREIAKKKQQDEKRLKKRGNTAPADGDAGNPSSADAPVTPATTPP